MWVHKASTIPFPEGVVYLIIFNNLIEKANGHKQTKIPLMIEPYTLQCHIDMCTLFIVCLNIFAIPCCELQVVEVT